jgi:hypothetical protein
MEYGSPLLPQNLEAIASNLTFSDGTDLIQLDTRPFPQDQVVGAQILQWSEDGEWLEVSLWDGHEGSYHRYRIRPNGSGEFEVLP